MLLKLLLFAGLVFCNLQKVLSTSEELTSVPMGIRQNLTIIPQSVSTISPTTTQQPSTASTPKTESTTGTLVKGTTTSATKTDSSTSVAEGENLNKSEAKDLNKQLREQQEQIKKLQEQLSQTGKDTELKRAEDLLKKSEKEQKKLQSQLQKIKDSQQKKADDEKKTREQLEKVKQQLENLKKKKSNNPTEPESQEIEQIYQTVSSIPPPQQDTYTYDYQDNFLTPREDFSYSTPASVSLDSINLNEPAQSFQSISQIQIEEPLNIKKLSLLKKQIENLQPLMDSLKNIADSKKVSDEAAQIANLIVLITKLQDQINKTQQAESKQGPLALKFDSLNKELENLNKEIQSIPEIVKTTQFDSQAFETLQNTLQNLSRKEKLDMLDLNGFKPLSEIIDEVTKLLKSFPLLTKIEPNQNLSDVLTSLEEALKKAVQKSQQRKFIIKTLAPLQYLIEIEEEILSKLEISENGYEQAVQESIEYIDEAISKLQ